MTISVFFLGLGIAGVLFAGLLAGCFVQRHLSTKRIGDANDLARRIIEEARKEAQAQKKEILVQGQDELFNQKRELENEYKEQERELKGREKKLQDMSERMEEKMERITQKEQDLLLQERDQTRKERRLEEQEEKLSARMEEQERRLQEVSGLTAEEAKNRLFEEIEARTRHEAAKMMRHIESEAREAADRKAKEILACAIQRYAGDIVHKCEQELDVQVREVGEQATFDAGVHGIHPDIVRLLGQLKYRTSFTQNVLQHSLEVSALCGMMAAELGMDIKRAKRAGLLHDIGKAVDHEVEGSHAVIGADIAKKYGEGKDIIHAIAAHHEDVRPETALAVLVQAADSLSGARPGARKELLENYVKRLEDLENIATAFDGVSKAYAIQAGRELRVMVNSDNVDDDSTYLLCRDIAGKIEENLTYPGQIRVTVIRERRAVGFAK